MKLRLPPLAGVCQLCCTNNYHRSRQAQGETSLVASRLILVPCINGIDNVSDKAPSAQELEMMYKRDLGQICLVLVVNVIFRSSTFCRGALLFRLQQPLLSMHSHYNF